MIFKDDDFVSGGISGAITNPLSKEAEIHAELYYKEIRKFSTDIRKIASNTGFTYDQVLMIKNYLFLFYHDIDGKMKQFDPCFEIAESWRRLAFDPQNIQPHDLILLQHELLEMQYVNAGYSQQVAHNKTEEVYNYTLASEKYYQMLSNNNQDGQERGKNFVGGGIMGYKTH